MRRLGIMLTRGAAIAGLLIGFAGTPALADHDNDRHWRHRDRSEHHDNWGYRRHHDHYRRGYSHGYYYQEPRVEYYAAPRVYVPPPPSFGLNLVFPFPFHH